MTGEESGRGVACLVAATAVLAALVALEALGPLRALDSLVRPGGLPGPRGLWEALSLTANAGAMALAVLALLAAEAARLGGVRRWTAALALSLLIAVLTAEALKPALGVPRPRGAPGEAGLLAALEAYSFPSGHTSRASAAACRLSEAGPRWALLAWLWAGLVALSRVALAAHWLSDVIAGVAVGTWADSLVRVGEPRWRRLWGLAARGPLRRFGVLDGRT
ncbi:MAG: phosphatase PAP2 family protein [Desulfurococcales archaeon]|nr:phosphatase PAP2 family protein [Desulfurococcales archaeon]